MASRIEWGSVPTWVGALSFFVGALSFVGGQQDKRREHASKVGAWIADGIGEHKGKYFIVVTNAGTVPTFEIKVKDAESGETLLELPELLGTVRKEVKKNGQSWHPVKKEITVFEPQHGVISVKIVVGEPAVCLELRDALGREWEIDENRRIKRVKRRKGAVLSFRRGGKVGTT
ncbi:MULTISPECIES: hypothetical protein [Streptomyces]|uniref:Uncharacterized protein n=1 Tax=Streptomyces griseosporeus TaxID=1910 RepID=A0ABV3KFC0_STRGS|nr:hypothetical protein [Streptomyces actuosus]MBM4822749.1 hypothetical protein [Streptomyces actuosus]